MKKTDRMTMEKLALFLKSALDEHREDTNTRFSRLEGLIGTLIENNSLVQADIGDIKREMRAWIKSEANQDKQIEDLDNRVTILELV